MSDESIVVDGEDVKKIILPCNCAAVLVTEAEDRGVSFYFCATHAQGDVALVYDVDISKVHEGFGWDYQRNPS